MKFFMNNWKNPKNETPKNYQRILICRDDLFIIMAQYRDGLYHDTRYNSKETISVLTGNFYWMELPSVEELKGKFE